MTVTPNPGLVNPESFMEASWSAGVLARGQEGKGGGNERSGSFWIFKF